MHNEGGLADEPESPVDLVNGERVQGRNHPAPCPESSQSCIGGR
jgi:hypothetical protein